MSRNPGKIYDLGNGDYGVAYDKDQSYSFSRYNRVFIRMFTDPKCETPKLHSVTGKKLVTLKFLTQIKLIGFID